MEPTMMIPSYFGGFGPPARFRQRKNPKDAMAYDFRAARTNLANPNNLVESVVHMMMCASGSGLVVLHAGYMECGMLTALGLNLLMSIVVSYCVCILVWSAQKIYGRVQIAQLSYPDVAEAVVLLSPWPKFRKAARSFRYVVEFTLAVHLYGSCSTIVIMISRNLKELVEGTESVSDAGDPPLRVYILSLMLPCVVVCMVTDLKYLAPFALIADIFAMAVIVVTVWYTFKKVTVSPFDRPAYKDIAGLFQFVGVCMFVLETASISIPLENNMDKPRQFHRVVLITMPVVTIMMMIIGFFGYWHHGEAAVAPITVHFPFRPFPIQLKVFLCLVLYVIYAMTFYVAFDIEWFYLRRPHQVANLWFWERLYRTIHVVLVTMLAYALPNVTRMMGIIGGIATSPAILLFPPFMELVLDWEYPGLGRFKWRLLKFIFMAIFGFVITCGGTYFNVVGMITEQATCEA